MPVTIMLAPNPVAADVLLVLLLRTVLTLLLYTLLASIPVPMACSTSIPKAVVEVVSTLRTVLSCMLSLL